jgi:hypothetical protein
MAANDLAHIPGQQQLLFFKEKEQKLEDSFWRFHADNPQVYSELVKLAREWRSRRGLATCGIKMLYEVCRWNLTLRTEGEPLKLNNNYHAFYARLMMALEPDLEGLFSLREQRLEFNPAKGDR